jgi:hypothetical protein
MTEGSGEMQNHWTKDDVTAACQRFERTFPRYIKRTKFYRKKMKLMRYSYVKRRNFVDD